MGIIAIENYRHHENWAFIETSRISSTSPATINLAPTYDHASSLGRELLDIKWQEKLNNRSVLAYAEKCRGALYVQIGDRKALKPLGAFRLAAQRYPLAARVWLERLASISIANTLALFNRIPNELISEVAIAFAQQILEINQQRLLNLQKELL
ncbi:MAG: hypothetical protein MUE44_25125 [Oscillatoriaceae cyanobacterium Prado104]|jgi:hypothetical protein|nr:hypothetical protein [Oscillatoriaceae cyanobacterium Prado104]